MRQYLDYLQDILDHGTRHEDRTGTGTIRVFGRQLRFDLTKGFPLLTTKRVWMRGVTEELLWFLRGETNIQSLVQAGVSIWTDWPLQRYREETGDNISQEAFEERIATDDAFAEQWGDLGPVYGTQWRDFEGPERRVDQIERLVEGLRERPHSRRHVVSAWHPAQVKDTALPPCFVPGEVVKTESGYKPVEEVETGDNVLTDNGKFRPVTETFETEYDGEVVAIKPSHCLETVCTPNHPFLTKDGWKEASEITDDDYLAVPRDPDSSPFHHEYQKFAWYDRYRDEKHYDDQKEEIDQETAWALGYFVGDGWVNHNMDKAVEKVNQVHFSIADDEIGDLLPHLESSFELSLHYRHSSGASAKFSGTSAKYADLLRSLGHKAPNKRVPEQMFTAPDNIVRSFLRGYEKADGATVGDGDLITCYVTTSRELALGVQMLYAKLGLPCGLYHQDRPPETTIEGRTVNQRDTYDIRARHNPKNDSPRYEIGEKYIWYKVQTVNRREPESGYVYNLAVEGAHTYTANNLANHNCHYAFQCFVEEEPGDGRLSLMWQQRSVDSFLGLPFNIASYALLTHMLAQQTGLTPHELIFNGGDCHIYRNHVAQVEEQLSRVPHDRPTLHLRERDSIFDYTADDVTIEEYEHHPALDAPIAV